MLLYSRRAKIRKRKKETEMYKIYKELDNKRKKDFDAFLNAYGSVEKLNIKINTLIEAKKDAAGKIISYLRISHYTGIKTDDLTAFLKESSPAPSFNQVIERVGNRISTEDRTKLTKAYKRLADTKEKSINLVVKKGNL